MKLILNGWFTNFPMPGKSFGAVTIEQLHKSLQNVYIKGKIETELDTWIRESEFLKEMPPEMYYRNTCDAFVRILSAYNSGITEFLKENETFHIWTQ